MEWTLWVLVGYAFLLAGVLVWEGLGLRSAWDAWPTITDLVRGSPAWLRSFVVGVCAWLAGHFATSGVAEGWVIAAALGAAGGTFYFLNRDD